MCVPLNSLGKIHEHPDGGDRVLDTVRLVADLNGEPQATDANLVNAQLAGIALVLLSCITGWALRAAWAR